MIYKKNLINKETKWKKDPNYKIKKLNFNKSNKFKKINKFNH